MIQVSGINEYYQRAASESGVEGTGFELRTLDTVFTPYDHALFIWYFGGIENKNT